MLSSWDREGSGLAKELLSKWRWLERLHALRLRNGLHDEEPTLNTCVVRGLLQEYFFFLNLLRRGWHRKMTIYQCSAVLDQAGQRLITVMIDVRDGGP